MKIQIHTKEWRFTIPVPLGLLCNRLTARLIVSALQKALRHPRKAAGKPETALGGAAKPEPGENALPAVPEETWCPDPALIRRLLPALRQLRRDYAGLVLVEVQCADGSEVRVSL